MLFVYGNYFLSKIKFCETVYLDIFTVYVTYTVRLGFEITITKCLDLCSYFLYVYFKIAIFLLAYRIFTVNLLNIT